MPNTERGIGHNSQVRTIEEQLEPASLLEQIKAQHVSYQVRCDALLAGVARFHVEFAHGIEDAEGQRRAADFVRQIKLAAKDSESARERAGTMFLRATKTVNAFFKVGLVEPLVEAARSIEDAMTAFAVEQERQRRKAAVAARELAEAEAAQIAAAAERTMHPELLDQAIQAEAVAESARKAASASPSDLSRSRGDLGGVASLRTHWTYRVLNVADIPPEYLMVDPVKVNAAIRLGLRDVPGLEIYNDVRAVVR